MEETSVALSVHLEPAIPSRDHVEGGQAASSNAESPWCRERGATVDGARHAQVAKQRIDRIRLERARQLLCHDGALTQAYRSAVTNFRGGLGER